MCNPSISAQAEVDSTSIVNRRPKIGLVLSGGGARGAAHVGVLKVLNELRIPIDFVAGNSMGALVGGNFAFGYSPSELQNILETVNWPLILSDGSKRTDLTFRRKQDDSSFLIDYEFGLRGITPVFPLGIAQGTRALNVLKFLAPGWTELTSFDDLPIPFRAVATDIANGDEVLLQSGSLPLALAASMAIPGVFAPVTIDGRELIDGMVVNNVPIDVAFDMGADVLIVVDVGTPILRAEEITSLLKVTSQMLNLLMQTNIDEQFALIAGDDRHTVVRPALGKLESGDFTRITEAIDIGEAAARAMIPALSRYSVSAAEYEHFLTKQRRVTNSSPVVDRIVIVNRSNLSDGVIRSKLKTRVGEPLDRQVLKTDLDRLLGTEEFERVSFEFPKLPGGGHELRILTDAKSWGPNYLKFGLNLEDDFSGASQYNIGIDYTMRAINELGGEWRTGAQIGELVGVTTEFYQPLDEAGRFFIAPSAAYSDSNLTLQEGSQLLANLDLKIGSIALDAGVNFSNWGELRMGFAYLRGLADVRVAVAPIDDFGFNDAVLRTRFTFDTLDEINFPSSGTRLGAVWDVGRSGWGADTDYQDIRSVAVKAGTYGRTTGVLIGAYNSKIGGDLPVYKTNNVGGFLNLSGLERGALTGERSARLAAVVYNQFAGARDVLFGFPTYLGLSLEVANATDNREDLFGEPLFGGSIFIGVDLPIAPLYFGYGRAEGGEQSLYLFLGQTF